MLAYYWRNYKIVNNNMNRPVRVLQITGGFSKGASGGVTAFLFNYFMAIDSSEVAFDFLPIAYQPFDPYRKDIENKGGRLYCLNVHNFKGIRGKLLYVKKLSQFLKDRTYDVIHINTGSFFTLFLCSLVSKLRGKKAKVIAHTHSVLTYQGAGQLSITLAKTLWKYVADYYFACSIPAGEYMFPKKIVASSRFRVIRNAIDSDKFVYNKEIRHEYRDLLGVKNELLIGHVGRFVEVKNHEFLIRVFKHVHDRQANVKLVLVGTGELEEKIRKVVRSLGLEHVVMFMGQRRDVNKIMQALDILLLPSLREGLGVVAVEAQAAGLPVITSEVVPMEAKTTDMFFQLPLDAGEDKWAEFILELCHKHERRNTQQEIVESGFDIKNSAKQLGDFYKKVSGVSN